MVAWLGKLSLASASVVATCVAVDLMLLLFWGPVRLVESFYESDARYGYRMQPNLVFEFANPYHGYRATVRTNTLGLRGGEVCVPKPAGVYRILLLGDSMTAGLEVDEAATFAAECERRLDAVRSTEVINAGVRGYNLDNILGYLHVEGLALDPDLVVYVFTDNDLMSKAEYSPVRSDNSRGFDLAGLRGHWIAASHLGYRLELVRQRLLYRRARDRREDAASQRTLPGGLISFFTHPPDDPAPPFRLTADRIAALAALCRERRIPFLLGEAPQRAAIDPQAQAWLAGQLAGRTSPLDFDGERLYLDHVAGQLGIDRVDPLPAFRAGFHRDRDYWFHRDGHLNATGHRLMGEVLAAAIVAQGSFRGE